MSAIRAIAEFVTGLRYDDLSPHYSVQRTKDHMLDQLGIQIGVSTKLV